MRNNYSSGYVYLAPTGFRHLLSAAVQR